jgi:hypothetical protein
MDARRRPRRTHFSGLAARRFSTAQAWECAVAEPWLRRHIRDLRKI